MSNAASGRTIVVVGGTGVSSAVRRLAAAGDEVVVVDGAPQALCAEIGERAVPVVADLHDPEDAAAACRELAAGRGAVHGLVTWSGRYAWGSVEQLSLADWEAGVRSNLTVPFAVTQALLPALRAAPRAAIVHRGTVDGIEGNSWMPAYSAGRAGLHLLTRIQARDFAKDNITVNCLATALMEASAAGGGTIDPEIARDPDFIDHYGTNPDPGTFAQFVSRRVPLGARLPVAEEVAGTIEYLLSDAAGYVTGQLLVIDGGLTLPYMG
jgi:NAD(P)-dependent dehydrogenase (short-subunit alcohol dehydrogenase family)